MKLVKILLCVTGLIVSSVFTTSALAKSVKLISTEYVVKEETNSYGEVFVECSGEPERKKMRRVAGSRDNWCSVDLPTLCRRSKIDIAKQMCRASFERLVEEYRTSSEGTSEQAATDAAASQPTVDKAALLSEQLNIEEQQIQIGQRRIDLRKKELELEKLELELSKQAGG